MRSHRRRSRVVASAGATAFANSHFGTRMTPADKAPVTLITCTLTSEGPMFATPWTLEGMLLS